ncbi:MAG: hypothetical protein PUC55_08175 [Lachnospiraceae bacterium]|nr:hypothetical protein [Lachnospiraceae bacterium]
MTKQKKGFLLFVASLIPGAGELYMGFRKMGLSIMALFWGCIAMASFFSLDAIIFLLPIIWFYSFFNTHNLKSLSEEDFHSIEDKLILPVDGFVKNKEQFIKRYRNAVAILLIFIGAASLCSIGSNWLYQILDPEQYYFILNIVRQVPAIVLSVFLIVFGVHLIRGKYEELENEETIPMTSHQEQKESTASSESSQTTDAIPVEQLDTSKKEDNSNENA